MDKILDTKINKTPETAIEAADSGFFVVQIFEELDGRQQVINDLAREMRNKSAALKDKPDSEQAERLTSIETMLDELGERIVSNEGFLVITVPAVPSPHTTWGKLYPDYLVSNSEGNEFAVFIPSDRITALRPNPHFYGNGHDTHPVIDIRIKTNDQIGQVTSSGAPVMGDWHQIPLETMDLALLSFEDQLRTE